MIFTILDCYTDEPAGLGVPPYIGTYPRYIAGAISNSGHEVFYITIDDLRFYSARTAVYKDKYQSIASQIQEEQQKLRTNIKIKNLSKNILNLQKILRKTDVLIVIAGVHTPGKYLSALPGTTKEVIHLLNAFRFDKFTILSGPVAHYGSGLYGGRFARDLERDFRSFDLIVKDLEIKIPELVENKFEADFDKDFTYEYLKPVVVRGAEIVKQFPTYPDFIIAEIETSIGCPRRPGCSFCTEPLKADSIVRRPLKDIISEMQALAHVGVKNFRLGKQSCFFSYGTATELKKLLKAARALSDVLHIDNANPAAVTVAKTKAIVEYCTEGNIAAFGVESFDPKIIKANHLNSDPETTYRAVEILNEYGAARGPNGMPKFLPGINLLFGLTKENRETHQENLLWLKKILDGRYLLRRINIRQVVIFQGTALAAECGDKYIRKNKKYYWKWRNEIRQQIDAPMLKRVVPEGTILRKVWTEIYDGNTTFGRQIGTYPLIVGIKKRLQLKNYLDFTVIGHMLRSVIAEPQT